MHISGALGMYHWELGNLSWDVLVHITNGFLGTLLFAAVLNDMTAASRIDPSTQAPATARSGLHDTADVQEQSATAAGEKGAHTATAGAPGAVSAGAGQLQPRHSCRERAWGVVKVTALLLLSTSLIEVVEAAGGQLAGHAGAQGQDLILTVMQVSAQGQA